MGFILRLIGTLTALAATVLLIVEGVRGSLALFWVIWGVIKTVIVIAFFLLLGLILYSLLSSDKKPTSE